MIPTNRVECRSDHAYLGSPLAFYWHEERLEVAKIVSESHNPAGYTFRVLNEEYGCFELIYNLNTSEWSVEQI
jgi:hypothetical protein